MKRINYLAAAIVLAIALITASSSFGRPLYEDKENRITERSIENLIVGINSTNAGLARSSVYFAGLYRITKAVDPLIKILKDPSRECFIRTLSAVSLSRIGEGQGLDAIKEVAINCHNDKLKNVCAAIYKNYLENKEELLTTNH